MHPDDLSHLPPEKLAQLLDLNSTPQWPAREKDSPAILRHQLTAPLLPDLATTPGAEPARLEALTKNRPFTDSFAHQLTAITPSLELLEAIKRFARHANSLPSHPLHGQPATLLYHAAIAAALLRCKTRITQLPNNSLRESFTWAAQQPGAEPLHSIFQSALADPTLATD